MAIQEASIYSQIQVELQKSQKLRPHQSQWESGLLQKSDNRSKQESKTWSRRSECKLIQSSINEKQLHKHYRWPSRLKCRVAQVCTDLTIRRRPRYALCYSQRNGCGHWNGQRLPFSPLKEERRCGSLSSGLLAINNWIQRTTGTSGVLLASSSASCSSEIPNHGWPAHKVGHKWKTSCFIKRQQSQESRLYEYERAKDDSIQPTNTHSLSCFETALWRRREYPQEPNEIWQQYQVICFAVKHPWNREQVVWKLPKNDTSSD